MSLSKYLQGVNIFPYSNFWRIDGGRTMRSTCSGLVSIPIIILIGILCVLKLIELIGYSTVYSVASASFNYQPPFTTITTSNTDATYAQFMVGIGVNNNNCPGANIGLTAFLSIVQGAYNNPSRNSTSIPINMQNCTSKHFSMLSGGFQKIYQWNQNPSSLLCLPLGKYYQIGGANTLSTLYQSLSFQFKCPSSCNSSTCGTAQVYTQNSFVNTDNNSNIYSYFLGRKTFPIYNQPTNQIYYEIDGNTINTDNSLLPFQTKVQMNGVSAGDFITDVPTLVTSTTTYLTLERSDKTMVYQRRFFKIFDFISYMGGLVYCIVLIFFFMVFFGNTQYETSFAAECSRSNVLKNYTFLVYIKQFFYSILTGTRCQPDWPKAKECQDIKFTAKKILDVIFLNKRLCFLEEAISFLFEKHQLKGLHLLHSLRKQKIDLCVKKHKFRDRVIVFLDKNKLKMSQSSSQRSESDNILSNQKKSNQKESHQKQSNQKESIQKESIQKQLRLRQEQNEPQKIHSMQKMQSSPRLSKNGNGNDLKLNKNILNHQQIRQSIIREQISIKDQLKIKNQVQLQQSGDSQKGMIVNEAEMYEMREEWQLQNGMAKDKFRQEVQFIGQMKPEELDELQLIGELETDLKRLVQEAERESGDERSKKIYGKLDTWLKEQLKKAIKKQYQLQQNLSMSNKYMLRDVDQ